MFFSGSMTTSPGNSVPHIFDHSTIQHFVIETLCLQCDLRSPFDAALLGCVFEMVCHMKSMAHGCGDLTLKFGHHGYQEFELADLLVPHSKIPLEFMEN